MPWGLSGCSINVDTFGFFFRRRDDIGSEHNLFQCSHCYWRRFEISKSISSGYRERGPAILVFVIPGIDVCAVSSQKCDDLRQILVSRAMHHCFAVVVNGIDVGT